MNGNVNLYLVSKKIYIEKLLFRPCIKKVKEIYPNTQNIGESKLLST